MTSQLESTAIGETAQSQEPKFFYVPLGPYDIYLLQADQPPMRLPFKITNAIIWNTQGERDVGYNEHGDVEIKPESSGTYIISEKVLNRNGFDSKIKARILGDQNLNLKDIEVIRIYTHKFIYSTK